jgi:hypothetical protein
MSLANPLSPEEFSSLTKIGCGTLLKVRVPIADALKLISLGYIEVVGNHYEATITGQLRIGSGS